MGPIFLDRFVHCNYTKTRFHCRHRAKQPSDPLWMGADCELPILGDLRMFVVLVCGWRHIKILNEIDIQADSLDTAGTVCMNPCNI